MCSARLLAGCALLVRVAVLAMPCPRPQLSSVTSPLPRSAQAAPWCHAVASDRLEAGPLPPG